MHSRTIMVMNPNIYSRIANAGVKLGEIELIQNLFSKLFGLFWQIRFPATIQRLLLQKYVEHYDVRMEEAQNKLEEFTTLQALFTREIRSECRPVDLEPHAIISPADGTIQNWGTIADGKLIQVKGIEYQLDQLVPSRLHEKFLGGQFMTIYLSPSDAHRLVSPVDGDVMGCTYVPGALFPLREPYVNRIEGLYARNERLTTYMKSQQSWAAIVKVGAFGVGNISTTYESSIRTNRLFRKREEYLYSEPSCMQRGAHLATFHLGSTVVLLFQKDRMFFARLSPGDKINYGQRIGIWA